MADILTRLGVALLLVVIAVGGYLLANRRLLSRGRAKVAGLDGFVSGRPALVYFSSPTCVPCRTIQRPAVERLGAQFGTAIQVLEYDTTVRSDLAEQWGILSVPTTILLSADGTPRRINHGVVPEAKLRLQVEALLP